MSTNGDTEIKSNFSHDVNISYKRFDGHSTISTCSSIVLSSCSSDEENDTINSVPTLKWKRQKILNHDSPNTDVLNNIHMDRNIVMSAKENINGSVDDERFVIPPRRLPPIPEDKFHRRNPHTVRQELNILDEFVPETTLGDVQLSEMPGLQNTEQWKRIAGRAAHPSPPLSRQYYQTVISTLELQEGQVPQPLGSYRRPGRSENEQDPSSIARNPCRAPPRRILFGSSVAVIIVVIIVAVVLAVTLVQKPGESATEYYSGSVTVRGKFDRVLFDLSSTLARTYQREFCSLVGTTLADTKTKYALFYSTCSITAFRNGSILADFQLGFTHSQNVTRLNVFLNRTLANKPLFGGTILSIVFNSSIFRNRTNENNSTDDDYDYDYDDNSQETGKLIMTEQNPANNDQPPTRTTYTTVTYTTLDKGLSITISETITITNNTLDKSPINNKNYELILVPTIDNTKTVVVSSGGTTEKCLLPPPPPPPPLLPATTTAAAAAAATALTTDLVPKSSSQQNLLRPIAKPIGDTNFAYIDESSDDHTFSSGDGLSTLGDLTTHDSTTSASTVSLNDGTVTNSTSTLTNNLDTPALSNPPKETSTRSFTTNRPTTKSKNDSSEEKQNFSSRPNLNVGKRQRRMVPPKHQRRLLQYELMPTGKVYYVDQPFFHENANHTVENDENSSVALSTILSRSSSLDTLSDKRQRHNRHHHHHHHHHQHHQPQQPQQPQQQQNRKYHQDLLVKKPEQKLSIGGRLASNNNISSESSFRPISANKKKRFSSFEPTPESLDRVFDVLIAADKRREEHEFWREKFDHRPTNSRLHLGPPKSHETTNTNTNTIPILRSKQTRITSNPPLNDTANRSQSYTNKRPAFTENFNRQNSTLLEDCLRRRTLLLKQQSQPQRNYSPNTIYSTIYPKQQLPPTGKSPLATTTTTAPPSSSSQQPVRILPLPNGRIGRAPQARQTSDEISTTSDIWATRSSVEEECRHAKKSSHHPRFQSTANRSRISEQKLPPNKRASSVEQQKPKNFISTKSKFLDLFKFNR